MPLAVGPERELAPVHAAAFDFERRGNGFRGGYTRHAVDVSSTGWISLALSSGSSGERKLQAPISLATAVVTADEASLMSDSVTPSLDDGRVLLDRGEVREELWNDEIGLHQEWAFDRAPEERGEIIVEVDVSGYRYLRESDRGLHFARADAPSLVYSHGLWLDSAGGEWPIAATFEGGRIRLAIPSSVIEQTVFPARLDPTLTAETPVDAPVVGLSGSQGQQVSIAYGGGAYLAVWSDNRESADSDIWATRVSAAGAILDPFGIRVAAAVGVQANPSVTFTGSQFVVAYESAGGISAAAVSTAGVASSLGVVATPGTRPTIVGRGDGTALVGWNTSGDLRVAIYNAGFGSAVSLGTGAVNERPAMAVDPSGSYFVSWSSATDAQGALVSSTGNVTVPGFTVSSSLGTQSQISAGFDGTQFVAVWVNNSSGINLYGTRVSTAGAVLDTRLEGATTVNGVAINTAANNQELPALSCITGSCLLTWQDRRNSATTGFDIYGQLLGPGVTLQGTDFPINTSSNSQLQPAVATTGGGYTVVWQDLRDVTAYTIYGAQVSTAGALGTTTNLSTGNNRQQTPAVGRVGSLMSVFWSDTRADTGDIYFARFTSGGSKSDSIGLSASTASLSQSTPAASSDLGTSSLVVWSDTRSGTDRDIYAARVNLATPTVLDATGFALTTGNKDQLVPDVASSGTLALAVWQDRRNATTDIYGAIVNASGAIVAQDIVISNATGEQVRPAVAWDAGAQQFIVVWSDNRNGTSSIYGTRVSTTGIALDAAGVRISNGTVGEFSPSVASVTAGGSFAVWQDRRDVGGYQVYGTRLTGGAALTVVTPTGTRLTSGSTGNKASPDIGTLGTSYVVAWSDTRSVQSNIYGQQITSTGTLAGAEFAIANSTDPESTPSLLFSGANNFVRVAYEVTRFGTTRVMSRLISTQSTGGTTCSSASQCSTGFCVDGKCCESACGGGDNTDCQACSYSKTLQPDGTCAPIPSSTMCRNYASTYCDVREYCDGTNLACPPDIGRNQGLTCSFSTNLPSGVGSGLCSSNAAPGPHRCQ